MSHLTIRLSAVKPAVCARGGVLEVPVRVQAPAQPPKAKARLSPKRLALVVDRSGSMDGQALAQARRCVTHIADSMRPADSLAVVVYDDRVDVVLPLAPLKSPARVRQLLATVHSGGSTDLFAGWVADARQLEDGLASTLPRVILQSDGQANHGLCDQAEIEKHCAAMLARGISSTTVGRRCRCNEDLMIAMSRAGGQQHDGQRVTAHGPMLILPALDAVAFAALTPDQAVFERQQEVEFAQASQEVNTLVRQGEILVAPKMLAQMEKRFARHPWFKHKSQRMCQLAERDPEMMGKEVRFPAGSEVRYSQDETESAIPAFLRMTGQEDRRAGGAAVRQTPRSDRRGITLAYRVKAGSRCTGQINKLHEAKLARGANLLEYHL